GLAADAPVGEDLDDVHALALGAVRARRTAEVGGGGLGEGVGVERAGVAHLAAAAEPARAVEVTEGDVREAVEQRRWHGAGPADHDRVLAVGLLPRTRDVRVSDEHGRAARVAVDPGQHAAPGAGVVEVAEGGCLVAEAGVEAALVAMVGAGGSASPAVGGGGSVSPAVGVGETLLPRGGGDVH